jgi:glyoxylase-like metal-dependent hydrolase (beta-lactamase superfamily II)
MGFVSQRSFGEVTVAVIDIGNLLITPADHPHLLERAPALWPMVCDDDGRLVMGQNVVVIRTPAATIIVDPCTFPDEELTIAEATIVPGQHMDRGLEVLGIQPREVTHVVATHLHEDHFIGLLGDDGGLRFPNAVHVLPAIDWRTIIIPGHPYVPNAEELQRRLPLTGAPGGGLLVEGEYELSPGVSVLPTPGETDGHQVVRVKTSAGRVYVLGDFVHWGPELEDPELMGPWSSTPTDVRRRIIADMLEEPATIVFAHERFPAWGTLAADGPGRFRWCPSGGG